MQASDVFFLTNNDKTLSSVYEQNCPAELTVPQGVEKIERRALADAPINQLVLPDSVAEIGANAFASCSEDLVIICGPDSRAKTYCEENGVAFRAE